MGILTGKKILIGATASVSIYKSCTLIQRLKEKGAEVQIALTPSAAKLVSPILFTALTGNRARFETFDESSTTGMPHIELARWADAFIIAPATANALGEMAHGLTQSLVTLVYTVFTGPILVAPAMNTMMLESKAVQKNIKSLVEAGVVILPSPAGDLACGESGEGKLLEPEEIVAYLESRLHQKKTFENLKGKNALILLGHTEEKIDDVRFISNRSSGKTALAIARALELHGMKLTLLCGKIDSELPPQFLPNAKHLSTTAGFAEEVEREKGLADVILCAAALSDFAPMASQKGKIKNSKLMKNIELKQSIHVLTSLAKSLRSDQILVGFSLENEGEESRAREKWEEKKCQILVVNTPLDSNGTSGFGEDSVRCAVWGPSALPPNEPAPLRIVEKNELAQSLTSEISTCLKEVQ